MTVDLQCFKFSLALHSGIKRCILARNVGFNRCVSELAVDLVHCSALLHSNSNRPIQIGCLLAICSRSRKVLCDVCHHGCTCKTIIDLSNTLISTFFNDDCQRGTMKNSQELWDLVLKDQFRYLVMVVWHARCFCLQPIGTVVKMQSHPGLNCSCEY